METEIREARFEDLPRIIRMIDEDDLGTTGDRYTEPLMKCYEDAFREITEDKNSVILVICVCGSVFGSLQLTFTRYLSHMGGLRATIENVHVASDMQGRGLGTKLMNAAIDLAKKRGCRIVQLTTNKTRKDAHRFYHRIGFESTHEGMKLYLK
ncbi:MAG TPA: GNAT family N-acetyltransferase [Candidatus Ornithomonoglobus merdipullorum]|uniref:GNAT family N-acetyltransferase n=1 Tax=Candidatus Ornithomonoglobus merdipullorum TaxID=2840895 RepID=A0A9D1SEY9_9FIRM|nr:GNAT family N-acetyltransferase [Candidatus Ornithomonoglobus merdipullorum]